MDTHGRVSIKEESRLPMTNQTAPSADQPPAADPFADAIVALVREQLRTEREDAAFDAVRTQVAQLQKTMAALQAVPLRNADEPHLIFRPVRGEG